MVIKRSKVKARNSSFKVLSKYNNVINLIDFFEKEDEIFMVYEQINVSLRLINSISKL